MTITLPTTDQSLLWYTADADSTSALCSKDGSRDSSKIFRGIDWAAGDSFSAIVIWKGEQFVEVIHIPKV